MIRPTLVATWIILGLVTAAWLSGCRSDAGTNAGIAAGRDVGTEAGATRWRLVVKDRDAASGRFMRFEVDGVGELRVGSGRAAQRDEAKEIVRLGPEDLEVLESAIRDAGWMNGGPPNSTGAGPRRLEIALTWGGKERRFTEVADGRAFSPETDRVLDALVDFSRRRFGGVLDGLPSGR